MTGEVSTDRQNIRKLELEFECLKSIPEGMSEVHLYWDPYLRVERVGKAFDISGLEADDSLPEPATLQAINHSNVVRVITAARLPDYPPPMEVVELITPYYPRGSITDALLRGERFAPTEAIRIAKSSLLGLAELHDVYRILHRDVKGGNVLLTDDHHAAVVADLGLASKLDENGLAITANNPTPYSPPEFFSGTLSVASDIYSMGLVLRELIAGHYPYSDYPRHLIISRLENGLTAIPLNDVTYPPYVPSTLRRVIAKACDSNPGRRYTSARAMIEALAKVVVLDWKQMGDSRWEAPFLHHPRSLVSVECKKKRDKTYRATVRTRKRGWTTWRRLGAESVIPDLSSGALVGIFDKATAAASTR